MDESVEFYIIVTAGGKCPADTNILIAKAAIASQKFPVKQQIAASGMLRVFPNMQMLALALYDFLLSK